MACPPPPTMPGVIVGPLMQDPTTCVLTRTVDCMNPMELEFDGNTADTYPNAVTLTCDETAMKYTFTNSASMTQQIMTSIDCM
uniref:C6 domain-containing protein n=1 Tax=Panagrolaimus sp. ES5 TaxID=591445 RepID=A0AC34GMS0_9BILA